MLTGDWYQQPQLALLTGRGLAGVDEVGRGPLAGPVVAAAVILDPSRPIRGLRDSKRLSARQREELSAAVRERALDWAVGECSVREIDRMNILNASLLAMRRALMNLSVTPDMVAADGRDACGVAQASISVVAGDARVPAISAASIVAKVHRDESMCRLGERHPQYGFERHKGYGTRAHLDALDRYGATPAHRRSFQPVRLR